MKQIEFEHFRDGIVTLHDVTDAGKTGEQVVKLRYADRTVSQEAYQDAQALGAKISRKIRVRLVEKITEDNKDYYRAIIGGREYKIIRVQVYRNNTPPVLDMSLSAVKRR